MVARGAARRTSRVVQRDRDRQDQGRARLPRRSAREAAQVHLLRASPSELISAQFAVSLVLKML